MMRSLLRSPPWPGVTADVLTIDAGRATRGGHPVRAGDVAAAMAARRVGGNFWGRQIAGARRLRVLGRGETMPDPIEQDMLVVAATKYRLSVAEHMVAPDVDPWPLIDAAQEVVCPATSEICLLARAAGRRVVTTGAPSSATDQEAALTEALLDRNYRDPVTRASIDPMGAVALLGRWRWLIDANRGIAAATGMAFWKRREVTRLLWDGRRGPLPFLSPAAAIARARREGGAVAAWATRVPADFANRAAAAGVAVRWVEDGFLRSAGLGSDLLPPLSLIVDDLWPYYDPARPSRLERILNTGNFTEPLLTRAAALRATIVERKIGKYNVGDDTALDLPSGARLVVVVGQVEDDQSVLRGGAGVTNQTLIERARAIEPDAFIVYRPHPDVEAGHRRGAIPDPVTLRSVDRIDRGGALNALLARAEALHTITSLSGFEALMRGVRVITHGSPFYSGWGLTEDRGPPLPRRTRRLTLDQLIAGALIIYPRYLDARTGLPCTPEQFIDGLGGGGVNVGWLVRLRRWQGRLNRLARGR